MRAATEAFLALCLGLVCARQASACASCGSGGDDPLILAPDESVKVYVAASRSGNYRYIEPGGTPGFSLGPVAKDVFTLAVGKSIGERAFVTATVPTVRNVGAGSDAWGLGDPSLTARLTVVPQSFISPWEPQVQLLAGFKPSLAASVRDSVDTQRLDVFGSGFPEARAGVDVWWGLMDWKFGAALTGVLPLAQRWHEESLQLGAVLRSTITAGYGWEGRGRLVAGMVREDQFDARLSGEVIADSGHRMHTLFATLDVTVTDFDTVRVSGSRMAAFASENISQANAMSLAYMRAW